MSVLTEKSYEFAQILLKEYHEDLKEDIIIKEPVVETKPEVQNPEIDEKKDPLEKYDVDYERFAKMYGMDLPSDMNKKPDQNENPENQNMYGCMHDKRKERDIYDRPNSEKLETAAYFKQEGNNAFKTKEFQKASYMYQKSLLYLTYTIGETKEEDAQHENLSLTCNLNMAAVKLNMKDYYEAISYCDLVIRDHKANTKAHYRKAQSLIELDKYEDAQTVFNDLFAINKNDPDVENLYKKLEEKQKIYKASEKNAYGGMFGAEPTI